MALKGGAENDCVSTIPEAESKQMTSDISLDGVRICSAKVIYNP